MSDSPSNLSLSVSQQTGRTIISVKGELDLASAPQLQDLLAATIETGCRDVALDFAEVSFIDSSGIAVLATAHKQLSEDGGQLVIWNPRPAALKVFDLTGLSSVVEVDHRADGHIG